MYLTLLITVKSHPLAIAVTLAPAILPVVEHVPSLPVLFDVNCEREKKHNYIQWGLQIFKINKSINRSEIDEFLKRHMP
jgi:hypothetical protein